MAFGADPFGDRAASEDLPQLESQPDSEGEPFYCELYPHCGCDPTQDYLGLTTGSDLAFGADPFGDWAASDDLPQLEPQPDSECDAMLE